MRQWCSYAMISRSSILLGVLGFLFRVIPHGRAASFCAVQQQQQQQRQTQTGASPSSSLPRSATPKLWSQQDPSSTTTTAAGSIAQRQHGDNVQPGNALNDDGAKKQRQLSVVVVGAGAVGSYYGARIWEAGHHAVSWYMREPHYSACRENGLMVKSYEEDIYIPPDKMTIYADTASVVADNNNKNHVDWVVVAVKSTGLSAIPDLIAPLLSPTTRVLVVMNGLIETDLIDLLKKKTGQIELENGDGTTPDDAPLRCCKALYGGMALLCSNRIRPGLVDHSYAGMLSAGTASSNSLTPSEDEDAFNDLFRGVAVDTVYEPSLLRGRWKKMLWNLPFNGLSVSMHGVTVDRIVSDVGLRRLAYRIMDETCAAANADLERHVGPGNYVPLGEPEKKQMMDLSDAMGKYKTSTMLDLVERRPMEVQYLFSEPVRVAKSLDVPVPHLETIVTQVEAIQRHLGLF